MSININRAKIFLGHLVPQRPIQNSEQLLLRITTVLKHLAPKVIASNPEPSLVGRARAAVRHLFSEM